MDGFNALSISTHPDPLAPTSLWKARGQQAFSLLLATVPIAERMLLYHLATAALIWIPDQGILGFLRPPSA
jgi:hypothetical protein